VPLLLLAGFATLLLVAGGAYLGWLMGREQGACEVGCAEATAGTGTGDYYSGLCRCTIDGVEVTLP
jgi:hypothetical protein